MYIIDAARPARSPVRAAYRESRATNAASTGRREVGRETRWTRPSVLSGSLSTAQNARGQAAEDLMVSSKNIEVDVGARIFLGFFGLVAMPFGILAFLGALRPAFTRTALLATAILCAGLGSARLLGAIAASEVSSYTRGGLVFELGSTAIAALLLRRLPQVASR